MTLSSPAVAARLVRAGLGRTLLLPVVRPMVAAPTFLALPSARRGFRPILEMVPMRSQLLIVQGGVGTAYFTSYHVPILVNRLLGFGNHYR